MRLMLRGLLLSTVSLDVLANELCSILGPVFPPPNNLSASASFQKALGTLNAAIDDAFTSGTTIHGPISAKDTHSIQIFSTAEDTPLFEYYHNGPNLVNGNVDGDSVYRLASVSKLYAVYLLLIEAGDAVFNEKVTKYLPELEGQQHWDEVTVGALAGHVSGAASDIFDSSSLTDYASSSSLPPGVFPPLEDDEKSPCVINVTHCTREQLIDTLLSRDLYHHLPNTTPAYSNVGFMLIGYILEAITGKLFEEILERSLKEPLSLAHTFASQPPNSSIGAIIYNETYSGWDIDLSESTATGGMYASAKDLATIGRAILSSRLIPSNTTRAWMKPTTFTSSLLGAVGRPWEIFRASISETDTRIVDLYTKAGNLGVYNPIIVLVPEFNAGWVIMNANEETSNAWTMSGIIADILLPALQESAREEADVIYAGTYTAPSDANINSTVTLTTTPDRPGLGLTRWISNGTDMFSVLGRPGTEWRLYPSNIDRSDDKAGTEMYWKANPGTAIGYEDVGPFSACGSWLLVDRPTWGLWGLDGFTFSLGEDGRAEGVEIKALKVVLEKEKD